MFYLITAVPINSRAVKCKSVILDEISVCWTFNAPRVGGHLFCRWIIYPFPHGRSLTKSWRSFMIYGKKLCRRDHCPDTLLAWNQTSVSMASGTNTLYRTQRFSMLVSCSKWLQQHNLWETRWIRILQGHVSCFVKYVSCVNYIVDDQSFVIL